MEVLTRDAVVATQVALGLVPEVLDPVDVIALVGEQLGVVDPHVMELGDVEHINGIENFWNQAKRHLRGYNGIPKQHFHLFIKECEWRSNYRPIGRMQATLTRWWFK